MDSIISVFYYAERPASPDRNHAANELSDTPPNAPRVVAGPVDALVRNYLARRYSNF